MGMYTGFKVKCKIKPKYDAAITKLHDHDFDRWEDVAKLYPDEDFLAEWAKVGRSSFIPFGSMCYMDDTWSEESFSNYDSTSREWSFECSLKNYENEIENFLMNVLWRLAEEIYVCESQYEEARDRIVYSGYIQTSNAVAQAIKCVKQWPEWKQKAIRDIMQNNPTRSTPRTPIILEDLY